MKNKLIVICIIFSIVLVGCGKKNKQDSMCGGIWHLYGGAGQKDGRFLGRCDRRLGNRKALPTVQREVCALCKRICKENERISVTFDKNEV